VLTSVIRKGLFCGLKINDRMFELIKQLKPVYFWDTPIDKLDEVKNANYIIRRVFEMGDIDEIALVHGYYGNEKCIEALLRAEYLRESAIIQSMVFLDIPNRELFECFDKKQYHSLS
jgi:hypothetical protein